MFMNKTSIGSAVAAALLALCASSASAQQSADITIDGTFVPPTCSVAIVGGGALDWGTVTRATVATYASYSTAAFKVLPTKTAQLDVACPNATVVGLAWTDNRAATKLLVDANDSARFGMANANIPGQAIGGFQVHYGTLTASGGAITATFVQPIAGGAWSTTAPGGAIFGISHAFPTYVSAFGRTATSATTPLPLLSFSIPLTIEPYVNAAIVSNSTSTIVMDGSATVTLKYF